MALALQPRPPGDFLSRALADLAAGKAATLRTLDDFLDDAPPEFVCPITCTVMRDPVRTCDGHCYDRRAIEQWLASFSGCHSSPTSPLTNVPLASKDLTPDDDLRVEIINWARLMEVTRRSLDETHGGSSSRSQPSVQRRQVEEVEELFPSSLLDGLALTGARPQEQLEEVGEDVDSLSSSLLNGPILTNEDVSQMAMHPGENSSSRSSSASSTCSNGAARFLEAATAMALVAGEELAQGAAYYIRRRRPLQGQLDILRKRKSLRFLLSNLPYA